MDEIKLTGLLLIVTALPGIGLGLALLMGKWNPASLKAAADPARARRATGQLLVAIDAMLVLFGIALLVAAPATAIAAAPWAVGAIVLAATLLSVRVVWATKA